MKYQPLIFITPCLQARGMEFRDPSLSLSQWYIEAVVAAGGLPCVGSCLDRSRDVAECVRRCDAVMLTGGNDVQPRLYAESLPARLGRTVGPPDARRDLMELELIRQALRQGKPLLAICRGQQILNVALGGSLVVDIAREIPAALDHAPAGQGDQPVHQVSLTPGSLLAKLMGSQKLAVNSSHHQAVGRIAPPLRATALSADGVVEALEWTPAEAAPSAFVLAVQFHPERLIRRQPAFLKLFRGFIRAGIPERLRSI